MTRTIWIGWDPREEDAYTVAQASLFKHASVPLSVQPLVLSRLKDILYRPIIRKGNQLYCPISQAPMATEFAISRFCIPFLQKSGWALFMDSDVLVRADIEELFRLADDKYAVMVVKHKQEKGPDTKMDGQMQTFYNRKNWSSIMLINCSHPAHQNLTPSMLNTSPGRDLHAFCWLKDEEIGELPATWNYLVGVTKGDMNAKIAHMTLGVPTMKGYEDCQFADEWRATLSACTNHKFL